MMSASWLTHISGVPDQRNGRSPTGTESALTAEGTGVVLGLADDISMLSPGVDSVVDLSGRWRVARTKSRCEKVLAKDLQGCGIGYFLPLIEQVKFSGRKKRRVRAPLFPGYVFFCGDETSRYTAMTTNRIAQTLDVADQDSLVRELAAIEKALAGEASLDPYPFAAVGSRCRVTAGPFRGLEGIVLHRDKTARLLLQVTMLGQGASIELDADLLESTD
jgi:transcription antitermination factor NusG